MSPALINNGREGNITTGTMKSSLTLSHIGSQEIAQTSLFESSLN